MKLTQLIHLGLEEKEARLYLACLELGFASIQGMARKAGTNRSSSYIILERLKAKKIISETYKGKRKVYIAAKPEYLRDMLLDKINAVKQEVERFDTDFLPELKSLESKGEDNPKVKFYNLKHGLEILRKDYTRSKDRYIYSLVPLSKVPQKYRAPRSFHQKMKKLGMKFKEILITNNESEWKKRTKTDPSLENYVKKLIIAKDDDEVECEIMANDKKVYITKTTGKPYIVIIEDKSIYNAIKYLIQEAQKSS